MVVGLGDGENFLASNLAAFLAETRRVQFPSDGEIASITPDGVDVIDAADGPPGRARRRSRSTGTTTPPSARATRRSCSRRSTSSPRASPRRSATASATAISSWTASGMTEEELRDLRRIVIVACGTAYHAGVVGRYVIEEWGARPGRAGRRERVDLPQPGDRSRHARDRHLAVGRDPRHDPGDEARAREGRAHRRDHEHDGLADHPRGRLGALHAHRPRGRRRRLEDVLRADRADVPDRPEARPVPRDAADRGDRVHPRRGLRPAGEDAAVPRRRPSDRGDRAAVLRQAVLPLPRPPHRAAGRARGRAEAEGDLLHPDRGLLGRRDEARPDRAARGGHARSSSSRRASTSTTRSSRTSRRPARAART